MISPFPAALLLLGGTLAACSGCSRRPSATNEVPSAASVAPDAAPPPRDPALWAPAKEGEPEDLAALAVKEGAAGLVEAAGDPSMRPTAIRAMGYARGWAQLPFLAQLAAAPDDGEARMALDAVIELAARPRRSEDPEDAEELKEGCEGLLALAKDDKRPRGRRVSAVRALRMMPCPRADLPTDLDAK